eukprot:2285374-Rhodomonas_salina.1
MMYESCRMCIVSYASGLNGEKAQVMLRRLLVPTGPPLSATSSHRHPSILVVACPPSSTSSPVPYRTAATPSP